MPTGEGPTAEQEFKGCGSLASGCAALWSLTCFRDNLCSRDGQAWAQGPQIPKWSSCVPRNGAQSQPQEVRAGTHASTASLIHHSQSHPMTTRVLPSLLTSCHLEANALHPNAGGFNFPLLQLPLPLCSTGRTATPLPRQLPRLLRHVTLDNYQVLEACTKSPAAGDTVTSSCTFPRVLYLTASIYFQCRQTVPNQWHYPTGGCWGHVDVVQTPTQALCATLSPLLTFGLLEHGRVQLFAKPSTQHTYVLCFPNSLLEIHTLLHSTTLLRTR